MTIRRSHSALEPDREASRYVMLRKPESAVARDLAVTAPNSREIPIDLDSLDYAGRAAADQHQFAQQRRHQRLIRPNIRRPRGGMAPRPILDDVSAAPAHENATRRR